MGTMPTTPAEGADPALQTLGSATWILQKAAFRDVFMIRASMFATACQDGLEPVLRQHQPKQ